MSASISDVTCPECGSDGARLEQDTDTLSLYLYCPECGYEENEDDE